MPSILFSTLFLSFVRNKNAASVSGIHCRQRRFYFNIALFALLQSGAKNTAANSI
jgi:hypothetical protein